MRIRTIKPEFWKHQRMAELPAETRLLAIGLLNYADDEGYFDAHPALIRGELMPYSEKTGRIPKMLEELSAIGFLSVTSSDDGKQIGHITNFLEHQRINRPTASKHSRKPHAALTESSVSPHSLLTHDSVPERKGTGNRERKGVVSSDDDEPELTLESANQPPSPPAGSDAKKKKGGRERNELLDALAVVGGGRVETVTRAMWGEAAKALSDIREVCPDVTASMIVAAASAYRNEWTNASLSPSALAKHWGKFAPGAKKEGARVFQGVQEPAWDWRTVARDLGLCANNWAMLERADKIQILRKQMEGVKP